MGNCQGIKASNDAVVDTKHQITKSDNPKERSCSNSSSTHLIISDRDVAINTDSHQGEPTVTAAISVGSTEETTLPASPSEPKTTAVKDWSDKRDYSSGASSERLGGSGSDESSSKRRSIDVLHLKSMRNVLRANGDLTQAVVRLETPFGKPIEEIYDGVHDGPYLGEGVTGVVRLITHRDTGVQYACKVLDIGLIQTDAGLRQLRDEISIMTQLDHPNIVRIEEVYESINTIYIVQELCLGGDLFDRLDDQPDIHYDEQQCSRVVKQIASATRYLHSKTVIHRDLKLENFLFSTPASDSQLKMIDFGLSKHFDLGQVHHEKIGTPYTCAPEVLRGSYDEKSDIWSMGVITYLLLSGETPFGGCYENECMADVRQSILSGTFKFEPDDIWEGVSDLAKKFVTKLLNVDPTKRPTAKEVQRDEWIQVYAGKNGSSDKGNKLSPKIVDALVNFKEYSEMRRLLHEVLSFTLLPEQIVELREEFELIDSEGDGEITLEAMKEVLMHSTGALALSLTEEEAEDIFIALRVNKNDSTIRWHEFIAAGLSQCNVDDRNLRLAFDRLDVDRKGFISFNDLTDLLDHAPETLDNLKKMWKESMNQCSCKSEKIDYDNFLLLMKGQSRRKSGRRSIVWGHQTEGLLPAQDINKVDDLVGDMNKVRLESNQAILEEDVEKAGRPEEIKPAVGNGKYLRKRSKSFGDISIGSLDSSSQGQRTSYASRVRPSVAADGDLVRFIANEVRVPLLANREHYKKHRDLRVALCEASKAFDMKRQGRLVEGTDKDLGSPLQCANLIMRRGSRAPADLESAHQRALVKAAVSRGGRHGSAKHVKTRQRRKRTQSDVTGMLLSPVNSCE